MQDRYRMYRRSNGAYYLEDAQSRRQESLRSKGGAQAKRLLAARNQAAEQPALNLTMARAYLTGRFPELMTRTWADVLEEMARNYHGATRDRFRFFTRSAPIAPLKNIPLVETESSHFLSAMRHPRAGGGYSSISFT